MKDLEIHYRKKTLLSIGQGASDTIINTSLEEKLPFTQIYNLLQGNENEIVETVYNLRSNKKKSDFIDNLQKLSKECYNYFFGSTDLNNETDFGNLKIMFSRLNFQEFGEDVPLVSEKTSKKR